MVKIIIPESVDKKEIKDYGYLKGKRSNATYIDAYYYDRCNEEVALVKITRGRIGKSDGSKTCFNCLIDSFLYECQKRRWALSELKCKYSFDMVDKKINETNKMIEEYMAVGLDRFNVEEVLEISRLYDFV